MKNKKRGLGTGGGLFVIAFFAFTNQVLAQQLDAPSAAGASSLALTSAGGLSPLLFGADLGSDRALGFGDGGYDTALGGPVFESAAEARIWGPVALRAVVTYANDTKRMRPSLGARVQLFRQAALGVDGSLSSFFKTEGFNEAEGEIETTLAIGRRFEEFYLLGNIAYGQDPEGNERDGEVRGAALRQQGRAVFGLEARSRAAIGPQHGTNSAVEPRFDAVGGPIAMVSLASFMLFAEAGPSAVKLQGADMHWGLALIGGGAAVF